MDRDESSEAVGTALVALCRSRCCKMSNVSARSVMTISRRKLPYWRRNTPAASLDIAKLRPKTLPRGKRFESVSDAHEDSVRSQALLGRYRRGKAYGVYLQECREGHY